MGSKIQKDGRTVEKFLDSLQDEQMRTDCLSVKKLMEDLTGQPAAIWGKDIIGFGSFRYRGKTSEGDWFPVGFAARKQKLVLYLHCILEEQTALLEKLGEHKIGKSCLYLKKLEDAHRPTLKKLIRKAYKDPKIAGAVTVASPKA